MDAVWDDRSDGSRDEAGSWVWDWSTRRGNLGCPIVTTMGTLRRICAKVREPSELRFGVVRGVDRGTGVLDGSPCRARGRKNYYSRFIFV